jgi:hypothetical protein
MPTPASALSDPEGGYRLTLHPFTGRKWGDILTLFLMQACCLCVDPAGYAGWSLQLKFFSIYPDTLRECVLTLGGFSLPLGLRSLFFLESSMKPLFAIVVLAAAAFRNLSSQPVESSRDEVAQQNHFEMSQEASK